VGVASLQPIAELDAQTTTATAAVVTGDAGGSRVLLASGGLPLVAEVHYGAGRVVQLAYDPLAEPLSSDSSLANMAWEQGLQRAGNPWGSHFSPHSSALAPHDQLWAPVLEPAAWPRWPPWALGMLAGYAAVTGLVVYRAGRSPRTRRRAWAAVPVLTVVAVAASVLSAARSGTADRQIILDTLGPDGTVLTNTYRTVRQLRPGPVQALGAEAATTMFTEAGSVRPILVEERPEPGVAPRKRPGGGVLTHTATGVGLPAPKGPWVPVSVQTITVGQQAGGLEAHLRLVGTARPPADGVKITGTVTNHSTQPLRQLRAQLPQGAQAHLADNLAPGATIKIDAALLWAKQVSAGSIETASRDDLLMFAAASRAFTRPGQIALIGLGSLTASGQRPAPHTTTLTVQPVALEAADQRVAYAGEREMVSSSRSLLSQRASPWCST